MKYWAKCNECRTEFTHDEWQKEKVLVSDGWTWDEDHNELYCKERKKAKLGGTMESQLLEIIHKYKDEHVQSLLSDEVLEDIQYLLAKVESFEDTFRWLQTLSKREDIIKIKMLEHQIKMIANAQWKYKRGDNLVVTKDFVTLITDFKPIRFKEGMKLSIIDPKPSDKKGESAYFVRTPHMGYMAVFIEKETLESITTVQQEELS